jgi:hypothetical protein
LMEPVLFVSCMRGLGGVSLNRPTVSVVSRHCYCARMLAAGVVGEFI